MAGPGICVLCLADTCTSEVHQCSILLHLMDICFLTCICLWQISQIQTFLFKVVGPGLVSTSPACVSSSASHPAGPHAQKYGKSGPHCWGRGGSTQFAQQLESVVTAPPLVGCVVWSHTELIITNVYIPPASSCAGGYLPSLDHLMMTMDTIILGDFNAHHSAWYSSSTDTRGTLLENISGYNFGILNWDSPTRLPGNAHPWD